MLLTEKLNLVGAAIASVQSGLFCAKTTLEVYPKKKQRILSTLRAVQTAARKPQRARSAQCLHKHHSEAANTHGRWLIKPPLRAPPEWPECCHPMTVGASTMREGNTRHHYRFVPYRPTGEQIMVIVGAESRLGWQLTTEPVPLSTPPPPPPSPRPNNVSNICIQSEQLA